VNFDWTPDQEELRSTLRRFAEAELSGPFPETERFRAIWTRCAAIGIQGLAVAPEHGGGGADSATVVAAMEALGYGARDNGILFSLNAQMWAVQYPIERYGSDRQKATLLPGLCDGSVIGAHGMSEPGSGSDAFALTTTATPQGDDFRLTGSKTFVTNGPVADLYLVFARLPGTEGFGGLCAFLLDRSTPGLSVGRPMEKMGLSSSPMSELFLDDCVVGPDRLLGRRGAGMAIFAAAMDRERSMILASTIGTMERNLDRAVQHARERKQFGQPIARFQAVSHRLVDMRLRLETARLLLHRLAWLLDQGRPTGLDSALVKLHLSESFVASSLDALQVFGGYGYMVEYGIEQDVRDAVASRLYSGTSDVQKNLAARHMGL
jgi:alkylation response protein AidB-like acyl-CoA dehydrogenase